MGSAEERKPWYRRFEVVFPLAALIVIIVLFVVVFALRDDLFGEEKPRGIGDFPELEEYWEGLCQKDNLTIESVMSAPDGVTTFFECNDSEDNWYILYPMNDDAMSLESPGESPEYDFAEYMDFQSRSLYLVDSEADGGQKYLAPYSYENMQRKRGGMYLDMYEFKEVEHIGEQDVTLLDGTSDTMDVWKGIVTSDSVKEVLGLGSRGLYIGCKEDDPSNTTLAQLLDYYISELDVSLTFSDGILEIGCKDGVVQYTRLEVGGLGQRLVLYKELHDGVVIPFEKPDLSEYVVYADTLRDLAGFVGQYDSYEEAMNALYSGEALPLDEYLESRESESVQEEGE